MNEHEKADARRWLIELWIDSIKDADTRHRAQVDQMIAESPDDPVIKPPWVLRVPSNDSIQVLVEGLEAVLAGKDDPFRLKPKGINPRKTRQERIDAIVDYFMEISRGKTKTNAMSLAGKNAKKSNDTIKAWLRETDLVQMAFLRLNQLGVDTGALYEEYFKGIRAGKAGKKGRSFSTRHES